MPSDLLVDGEHGVWHLANDGALTWHAFATLVATRAQLDVALIDAVPTEPVWSPAVRPRFSALSSVRGLLLPSLETAINAYVGHQPWLAGDIAEPTADGAA